jgi:transcriptional regulator with XRE-family HTH domain
MRLSDLHTAAEIHERDMRDPEYQREYDRGELANDVALRVLAYRTEYRMSQTELARLLGMRQPNIARLESGEHEPTLTTLARLSEVLPDFSIDFVDGRARLRQAPRRTAARRSSSSPVSRRRRAAALPGDDTHTPRPGAGRLAVTQGLPSPRGVVLLLPVLQRLGGGPGVPCQRGDGCVTALGHQHRRGRAVLRVVG